MNKNIYYTLLLAISFFSIQTTHAQTPTFDWAKQFGGTAGGGEGISITRDASGNIYTTGSFSGTVDFDPGVGTFNLTSAGSRDIFISKLDATGNFVWAKQMGGTAWDHGYSITTDVSGNIYTTGRFIGTADFDPGTGTFNLTSVGTIDMFISKLNSAGDFVWAIQLGGPINDSGFSITTDNMDDIYISGFFEGTVDFNPGPGTFNLTSSGGPEIFICKLDASSNFIWAKKIASETDYNSITTDASNNLYIGGNFKNTVDFDPGPGTFNLTSSGASDIYICKLDASGNFVWAKQMGGTTGDYCFSIAVDASSNVYTTGTFYGTTDFDPGPSTYNLSSAGSGDIFISKLDAMGNFVWAKQMGGIQPDDGEAITTDVFGNVYITGSFQETVDFDPGSGTQNHISVGLRDIFVLKLDAAGNFVWSYQMGGIKHDYSYSIITDAVGSVYTTGNFSGTVDFDPSSSNFNLTSSNLAGGYDIFVHKMSQCLEPIQPSSINGSISICNGATETYSVTNDPNVTSYTWTLPSGWSGTSTTNAITVTSGASGGAITVVANNACGISSVQTLSVIIEDVTAPVADVTTLANVTAECSVTSLTAPTATDNCAGSITGTHNATLPITTQGTTTVTWTYDDGNGNTSIQTQSVVIDDVTAPAANTTTLADITSECSVTSLTAPTATDNCAGSITGTHNATLPITTPGTTTVTWTYNDGNGNTTNQTQNVVITPINNGVTQIDALTLSANAVGYDYQWVDCNNGNQAINGQTGQTFTATANGSYAVMIDNGSCTVTSNCTLINSVGIDEVEGNTLHVFPNPTHGEVTIKSSSKIESIEVMNALGQVVNMINVKGVEFFTLKLPNENGLYFINVKVNGITKITRVVKN